MARQTSVSGQAITITIEKLGQPITWTVPTGPYRGKPVLRTAYVAGFQARRDDVNQGLDRITPEGRYTAERSQEAFAAGYAAARAQDTKA